MSFFPGWFFILIIHHLEALSPSGNEIECHFGSLNADNPPKIQITRFEGRKPESLKNIEPIIQYLMHITNLDSISLLQMTSVCSQWEALRTALVMAGSGTSSSSSTSKQSSSSSSSSRNSNSRAGRSHQSPYSSPPSILRWIYCTFLRSELASSFEIFRYLTQIRDSCSICFCSKTRRLRNPPISAS